MSLWSLFQVYTTMKSILDMRKMFLEAGERAKGRVFTQTVTSGYVEWKICTTNWEKWLKRFPRRMSKTPTGWFVFFFYYMWGKY